MVPCELVSTFKKKVLEKTAVSLLKSDLKAEVAGLAGNTHSVKKPGRPPA